MFEWLRGRESQSEIDREMETLIADLGGDPSIVARRRAQRTSDPAPADQDGTSRAIARKLRNRAVGKATPLH